MLTLYDYLPSQNAWKVRQLLHHLQWPYRRELVSIFEGDGQSEDYRLISPTGTVPAIQLADGRVLAESNAILFYLANDTAYLPGDHFARAKVLQWLSFEQERIESQVGALRHWTLTGKLPRRAPAMVESKRAAALKALAILDTELSARPFVVGDAYSIADIALYAYSSRAEEANLSLQPYSHLRDWFARVRAQPRFLAEMYPYSNDPYSVNELP